MKTKIYYREKSRMEIIRDWILIQGVEITKKPYVLFFKSNKTAWNISSEKLLRYPHGSLGKNLGIFLRKNKIELMDKLEDHDVMHVLLEKDTTVSDEALIQWMLLGNGKRSLFCFFTAMLSYLLIPTERKNMLDHYHTARSMKKFYKWDYQFLLREPKIVLQKMIQGHPFKAEEKLETFNTTELRNLKTSAFCF